MSTREYHVMHIASAPIVGFWSKDPGITPQHTDIWLQNVKESKTYPV